MFIIFLISQLYVELTGTEEQPTNVPATVHLRIRHLSGSYFRAGDDEIKEFRQPLGSFRKIKFRRTAISDETKCTEEERKGNSMFKEKFIAYISKNFWVELSGMSPETPKVFGDSILDLKCHHFGFNDDVGSL